MIANMEDTKFLGIKRDTLMGAGVLIGTQLTTMLVVVALFGVMNSSVNRLDESLKATNAAIADVAAKTAANGAAIEALILVTTKTNADLDALTAEVVELRVETAEIKARVTNIEVKVESIDVRVENTDTSVENIEARVENIERNLPDYESVDNRLEDLERGQADLKAHVDALAAAE